MTSKCRRALRLVNAVLHVPSFTHMYGYALLWCGLRVIISLLVLIEKKVYPISWLNETTTGD